MKSSPTIKELRRVSSEELKRFGWVLSAGLVGIFGGLLPWLFHHPFPHWPWWMGGAIFLLAMLTPRSLSLVYVLWMKLGFFLGEINTKIILTLLFYLMIFPIGRIKRWVTPKKKNPFNDEFDDSPSYRVKSDGEGLVDRMRFPF